MSLPRYADLVRRLVRHGRAEPTPSVPSNKRRLVAAVEEALRARARRRSIARRATRVTLSAAALVLLAFGARTLWRRPVELHAEGVDAATPRALAVLSVGFAARGEGTAGDPSLRPGMSLERGAHLTAPPASEVRFGGADGTVLSLEPRGELTVTEASTTRRFALRTGAVRARVAHLSAGDRFVIDTVDAEVEVHGTEFRVSVVPGDAACGEGSTTRVSVTEGVVSVRAGGHEARVLPGQTWPAGCAPSPTVAPVVPTVAISAERLPRAPRRPRVEPAAPTPPVAVAPAAPTPTSELRAQNDLFSAAVRAKNLGQAAEAARLFGRIVVEYPSSPLAEGASVQRMKALAVVDAGAGARAAADYLERYPSGFARPEAVKLLARPTP